MKRIFILILVPFWAISQSQIRGHHNVEILLDGVYLNNQHEIRFTSDDGMIYHHSDIGLGYQFFENTIIGFNLREAFDYKEENSVEAEYRPQGFIKFKYKFFSNKFRYEHRIREGADKIVLRNKMDFNLKVKNTYYPYFSNEFFYYENGLNANRLALGIHLRAGITKFGVYYMIQSTHGDEKWESIRVLGFSFKLKFEQICEN